MSVTFNNNTFTAADSAVGVIANTNVLGIPLVALVGTSLTSSIGATSVTVNGTVGAVGSTASVSINAAGIALTDPNSTYVGYSQNNGVNVYYFNVAGTNSITGQLATVGVAVSAEGVPSLLGVQLQTITPGAAPADPILQPGATYGAPVLQSSSVNGNTVTLAYNVPLSTTPPLPGSFAVAVNGTAATVTGATVSGQSVILTLATPVANGQTVTVGYTDPTFGNDVNAVQDIAGTDAPNVLLAIATNNTPQAPGPVLQTATVVGNTVTLGYNEALGLVGPGAGSYDVTVAGTAVTVLATAVSGQNIILTLATPVANGQAVTVGYRDPTTGNDIFAAQDTVGNDAATSAAITATNNTPQALGPVLQTATVVGNTVTLGYNEALSLIGPGAGSYNVTVAGNAVLVLATAVSGQNIILTLATPVANGQAVTVGYRDPTTGNDIFAAQDTVGNDAATTLTPITAINNTPQALGPVLQTATVNGNTVTLTYNETLSLVAPANNAFAVTAGGAGVNVTSAIVSGQTVTLTLATPVANGQAVTVSYTDPSSFNDIFAVQDVVGNDAATTLTPIAAANNTPQAPGPVLQSATVNGNTLTLAYNETLSPTGPATGAFAVTVGGAVVNVTAAAVSGQTIVLTLATPVANGQTVTVGYRDPTAGNDVAAVQDTVGNDAATTVTPITAVNNTPQAPGPGFLNATVDSNVLTLTYDETLSGTAPQSSAFAVSVNGVATAVTGVAVSGPTVVLTLATPVANGQAVTVGYTDPTAGNDVNAVQDSVGNDAASLTPTTVSNNTPMVPGPVLQTASVTGNTLTLAYNETLSSTRPNASSFAVIVDGAAATVIAAAVSGQTVILTLATPVANGQAVTVGYTDPTGGNDVNAVQDANGIDASTSTGINVTNNTPQAPGPVLQTATVAGNTLTLAYNETLSATGPDASAFTVKVDGAVAAVSNATVSGQTVMLTLATPVANGQAVTVGYTDPTAGNDVAAVQDTVGNDASTTLTSITAANNTPQAPGPVLQTATVNGNTLTLAYNETLSPTGPATSAFAVTVGGAVVNVTAAAVSGQTVVLTLAAPVANGQAVTVGYTDPTTGNDVSAVQDTVGNDASTTLSPIAAANTTPQAPGPVLQTATVTGNTLTLAYNEALSLNGPATGAFAVSVDGQLVNVSAAAVSGQTVVLTLATPVANGQAVIVGYTDPTAGNDLNAVQDFVGNDAATRTDISVTNNTPQAPGPVFQTATVTGNTVTLTYNETLSGTGPAASAFAVTVDGAAAAISNATVSGQTVVLTLATPVANGQAVTVGYTDPTAGNDVAAVQDTRGNDAATLTATSATNATPQAPGPVLQSATVNGNTLTLSYNETLSSTGPATGAFAVTVGGVVANVTAASVSGQTVVLTLAVPVANGQAVTVGYTDPTAGNDVAAVQDSVGNDAATTVTPITVVNNTPQAPGPLFLNATVDSNVLTLAYNETLSGTTPPGGAFAVSVNGVATAVTGVAVSGQNIVLTLATPVANGQAVTVGYTDPTAGNDIAAVQDTVGNDAATLTPTTASNITPMVPGPVLQTASVTGDTLILAYNETLSLTGPDASSFAVKVDGAVANVTAASVSGQTVTLTLATPVANGQVVTVGYTDPTTSDDVNAVQDAAGNDASTTLSPTTATNNTAQAPGPVLQTATVNGSSVTLGYNETLSANGPATGAYTVKVDNAVVNVTAATVSGQTVTLTLATPVANGQAVTVGYTDPTTGNDVAAVQDTVGNDAATTSPLTPFAVTNITAQAPGPAIQTATVNGSTLTLAYNEALSPTGPATSAFAVRVNGTVTNVTGLTISGQTAVLTLATPVANGQAVTVGYTDRTASNDPDAIQDTVGNDASTTLTSILATNATPQAPGPVLQTATVAGSTVTLAYDKLLSATGPATGAFAVTANGTVDNVIGATVAGQTVTLTLATAVANGQAVTVGYTDPTTGNDIAAVQDVLGNDAATLTPVAAANATSQAPGPVLQTATVTDNIVTLAYDKILSTTGPATGSFAVTAAGAVDNVTAATVSGQTVTLTLATPVANGQVVTLGYMDPTVGNDVAAVQDSVGNDAATLLPVIIANSTPVAAPGPVFQSATANANTVTLAYNEALSPTGPLVGSFAVAVDGTAATVTGATVSGQSVVLTLAAPVAAGQLVTVGYTDPSIGNDAAAIQDLNGDDASSFVAAPAANSTTAPGGAGPGTGTGTGGPGTGTGGTGTTTTGNTVSSGLPGTAGSGAGGTTGTTTIGGASGGTTTVTTNADGTTTVVTTMLDGSSTTQTLAQGSAISIGTRAAQGDVVSVDPEAVFEGRGKFTVSGHVASGSGITSVSISAVVDGAATPTTLGTATVASDGSYTFADTVGAHLQGFITATATDLAGATTAAQAPYSLQAGLNRTNYVAEQDRYLPDGSEQVSTSLNHNANARTVNIMGSGQTFSDDQVNVFNNHGGPSNTFVFNPGHGRDVITQFRANGVDHDTLSLNSYNGSVTLADVLQNTRNVSGGVLITDPNTGDSTRLTGVSKGELVANPSVFAFHA